MPDQCETDDGYSSRHLSKWIQCPKQYELITVHAYRHTAYLFADSRCSTIVGPLFVTFGDIVVLTGILVFDRVEKREDESRTSL